MYENLTAFRYGSSVGVFKATMKYQMLSEQETS